MPVVIETPAWAKLEGFEGHERALEAHLRFRDERAAHEYRRFINSPYNHQRYSAVEYQEKLQELKDAVKRTLLRREEDGSLWIPAGKAHELAFLMNDRVVDRVHRPESFGYPWHNKPDKEPRPYQTEAVEKLLEARHGAIEIAPGGGKTLAGLIAVRRLGLPSVVISPFSTIVKQTYREYLAALGPRRVGLYGNGKHNIKAPVTIATAQALNHVKRGTPAWDFFASKAVLSFDECHLTGADTISDLCLGMLARVPYRFFWSGTCIRTDGLQPLLDGIIGPILMSKDVEEMVDQGFLAYSKVRIVEVTHGKAPRFSDPMKATQEVLFRSPNVYKVAGHLANVMVAAGRPVLALVDELDQYASLAGQLKHESFFAHSCADADTLKRRVPAGHHKPDVLKLVDRFNDGEFKVLVGTSAIGTGVDVRACGAGFYLRGGCSETDVRQCAGRFMRLHPGKTDVVIFDVDVVDGGVVHRHAVAREKIWRSFCPDVQRVQGLA